MPAVPGARGHQAGAAQDSFHPHSLLIGFGSIKTPFLKLNIGHFTVVHSAQAGCEGWGTSSGHTALHFSSCIQRGVGREASAYLLN